MIPFLNTWLRLSLTKKKKKKILWDIGQTFWKLHVLLWFSCLGGFLSPPGCNWCWDFHYYQPNEKRFCIPKLICGCKGMGRQFCPILVPSGGKRKFTEKKKYILLDLNFTSFLLNNSREKQFKTNIERINFQRITRAITQLIQTNPIYKPHFSGIIKNSFIR